jgi:hypothetical protein
MKKLATIVCLGALALTVYGQGTVNFLNGTYSLVNTNGSGLTPATGIGPAAGAAGDYVYGVFTASSAITSIGSALDLLPGGDWNFTGLYGNSLATAGRVFGGNNVVVPDFWAPGQTNSYAILGWSKNLGTTGTEVLAILAGGEFQGGNVYKVLGAVPENAWLGVSARAFGMAGGGTAGLPAFSLFGTADNPSGSPLKTGWDLFGVVTIPEPGVFALIGMGLASLVIFRRRE